MDPDSNHTNRHSEKRKTHDMARSFSTMKQDIGTRLSKKSDDHTGRAVALVIVMQDPEARQAMLAFGRMILEHPTVPTGIILLVFAALAREVIRDGYQHQWGRRR